MKSAQNRLVDGTFWNVYTLYWKVWKSQKMSDMKYLVKIATGKICLFIFFFLYSYHFFFTYIRHYVMTFFFMSALSYFSLMFSNEEVTSQHYWTRIFSQPSYHYQRSVVLSNYVFDCWCGCCNIIISLFMPLPTSPLLWHYFKRGGGRQYQNLSNTQSRHIALT